MSNVASEECKAQFIKCVELLRRVFFAAALAYSKQVFRHKELQKTYDDRKGERKFRGKYVIHWRDTCMQKGVLLEVYQISQK